MINKHKYVFRILDNGTLAVWSSEAGDEGEYTCRADNSVPPSLSKSVNLQLEGENRSRNI